MTPTDRTESKHWLTAWFLLPLSFVLFQILNGSYLIHQPAIFVWLIIAVFLIAFLVAGLLWARFVPRKITLIFATIAWLAAIAALLREL